MACGMSAMMWAQTAPAPTTPAPAAPSQATPSAKPAASPAKPLQLHSLSPDTVADPFPATNPKFFTADSPSVATVDSYLRVMLGYDSNRIWRVVAIQKTAAPGVARVTALVSEKTANAKVQQATFFVLNDGKHLIADNSAVLPFGAEPYAAHRAMLQSAASGPHLGSDSKSLMLVEFSDLQCPHCKEAQPTIKHLAQDFPQARIVYQSFPLTDIHPFAFQAAAMGACLAKKSDATFFSFADAVYDTQAQLTAEAGADTLKAAVIKAGGDPAATATCAESAEAKATVDASIKLAQDLSIEQTPTLLVNGRPVPLNGIPYETIKQIIVFQAGLDGMKVTAPVSLSPPAAQK